MKIRELINLAKQKLENSSTPKLDAELLFCTASGKNKNHLITHCEQEVKNSELEKFHVFLKRRMGGEPMAYIMGEKEFYGRNFKVNQSVLIPRPETEEMVERAINYLKNHPEIRTIIDLGTGSGCIAITISMEFPARRVIGLEISNDALKVAKLNKKNLCPGNRNLQFRKSDLFATLTEKEKHERNIAVISNLPYIGKITNRFIARETEQFEPHIALFGGDDGLEIHRRSWQQVLDLKLDVSYFVAEIGFNQGETVRHEIDNLFPKHKVETHYDLAGIERAISIRKCT